jgi:hypothetical protein
MPRPIELSHRTGWLCLTRVELEEALEAVEDLLTRGSNNLYVSDSPYLGGLNVKSVCSSKRVNKIDSRQLSQFHSIVVCVVGMAYAR